MTHNSQTRSKLWSPMWPWNNKHAPVCVIHDVTSRATTAATQRINIVSVDHSKQFFSYLSVLRSIYNDDDERPILNLHLHWETSTADSDAGENIDSRCSWRATLAQHRCCCCCCCFQHVSHSPAPLFAQNNYFLWPVDGSLQFIDVHLIQTEVQSAEFSRRTASDKGQLISGHILW